MRSKQLILAGALALVAALAPQLKADVQARVNVVAHALASARHLSLNQIAVSGFIDAATGQKPPFAAVLEADLRQALTRYGSNWTVLGADASTASADALVTGSFQRDGDQVDVHVQVLAQPEGTVLWQRDTFLDGSDVGLSDLPAGPSAGAATYEAQAGPDEGPGGGDQAIPTLPYGGRSWDGEGGRGGDFDLNVAYKVFFPTNSSFKNAAGTAMNGISFGLSICDVFLADMDFWEQNINNVGTVQNLDYAGTDVALVLPIHLLDRHLCLYVGPGGRFGEIMVNDPALDEGGVGFGNNAFTAVAGVKWKQDHVGLDLRYTYDLDYSYTGYNTLRLGAFYEFGR